MERKELILIALAFISIYFIWGSTYLFNKLLLAELQPFSVGAFRFTFAGAIVVLLSLVFSNGEKLQTKQLINCAIAGFLFLTTGNGIAVWALQFVDTGVTALLISAQPLVLLFLMRVLEGKKIMARSIIGVALGILGIYLLVSQNELNSGPDQWKGYLAILSCLFFWGYGSLFVASRELPKNSLIASGYQMLFGGILMILTSFLLGEDLTAILRLSEKGFWSMSYLVVFGSIAAFTSFNFLLKRVSPEKVATSTYINPIVAMILGVYWLGEKVTMLSIIAAIILLGGVWFINSAKSDENVDKTAKPIKT